jgi:hypothetical protein
MVINYINIRGFYLPGSDQELAFLSKGKQFQMRSHGSESDFRIIGFALSG